MVDPHQANFRSLGNSEPDQLKVTANDSRKGVLSPRRLDAAVHFAMDEVDIGDPV
jgi:hypothetical protein